MLDPKDQTLLSSQDGQQISGRSLQSAVQGNLSSFFVVSRFVSFAVSSASYNSHSLLFHCRRC